MWTNFSRLRAVRTNTMAFSSLGRQTFDDITAGVDAEQLQYMKEWIVQVDQQDNVLGPISKKDAHIHDGVLHRAFSIFVFNPKNELLIQKRARHVSDFLYSIETDLTGLALFSHPLYTESELKDGIGVKRAAIRKLEHELGIPTSTFTVDDISFVSKVMYKASSDANWTEYEMDHILFARGVVPLNNLNKNEVEQVDFVTREHLPTLLDDPTRSFSPWFRLICSDLLPHWWDNLDAVLENDSLNRSIHDFCPTSASLF